jgi:hypothetical protein
MCICVHNAAAVPPRFCNLPLHYCNHVERRTSIEVTSSYRTPPNAMLKINKSHHHLRTWYQFTFASRNGQNDKQSTPTRTDFAVQFRKSYVDCCGVSAWSLVSSTMRSQHSLHMPSLIWTTSLSQSPRGPKHPLNKFLQVSGLRNPQQPHASHRW